MASSLYPSAWTVRLEDKDNEARLVCAFVHVACRLAASLARSGIPTVRRRKPIIPTRLPSQLDTTKIAHGYCGLVHCTQALPALVTKVPLHNVMALFFVPYSLAFEVFLCHVDQSCVDRATSVCSWILHCFFCRLKSSSAPMYIHDHVFPQIPRRRHTTSSHTSLVCCPKP
jgi:hypothetical protein